MTWLTGPRFPCGGALSMAQWLSNFDVSPQGPVLEDVRPISKPRGLGWGSSKNQLPSGPTLTATPSLFGQAFPPPGSE